MTEKRKEEIKARSKAYHLEKYNCEGFFPDFEVGAEWNYEHPESKYNLSDVDYIRCLLVDIANTAERLTSCNVSHNAASIRLLAQSALKVIIENKKI